MMFFFVLADCVYANEFYVDAARGRDNNNGKYSTPFKTISKAVTKLSAGDTLFLSGGRYFEKDIVVSSKGTEKNKIKIKAIDGEFVVVDGGIKDFRALNNEWDLFNVQKNIYVSKKSYRNLYEIEGHFIYNDKKYKLISYHNERDFSSISENFMLNGGFYAGPGVLYDKQGKIFIRLQRPKKEAIDKLIDIPAVLFPESTEIFLTGKNYGFLIKNASYLIIEGIQFENHRTSLRVKDSDHLQLINLKSYPGKYSIILDENIQDVLISGCSFEHYHPEWIAWSDVKIGGKPSYSMQDNAIEVRSGCERIFITNCSFKSIFDGIDIIDKVSHVRITKCFFEKIQDDCLQLGSATYNIEVDHNFVKDSFTAFSRHGSGKCENPGSKFFHHNIIDSRTRFLAGRKDPLKGLKSTMHDFDGSPWVYRSPISQHNYFDTKVDPWKIYNNTFLFGRSINRYGAGHTLNSIECDSLVPHEVYNNVFWQIHDGEIARGANMDGGCERYDGNLYFRSTENPEIPMFFQFKNGKDKMNFYSLNDLRKSTAFDVAKEYYSTEWDKVSISSDPEINDNYVPTKGSPCLQNSVTLPPTWPGVDDTDHYRGAVQNLSDLLKFFVFFER